MKQSWMRVFDEVKAQIQREVAEKQTAQKRKAKGAQQG